MTENRLRKYTMTVGTTIAAAAAGSAHAGIVSSVSSVNVTIDTELLFNFGPGGMAAQNVAKSSPWDSRSVRVGATNFDLTIYFFNVNNVDAGTTISSAFINSSNKSSVAAHSKSFQGNPKVDSNNIDAGANQLLAFGMAYGGESYFGWIDYTLDASGGATDPYTFTINAWAYNDVADQGIIAGEARAAGSSGGAAVPGLGGLAGLAIGAAGVRTRRQRIA